MNKDKDDAAYIKGSDNVIGAVLTGRSKFGIKNGTLHEFEDDFHFVKRVLTKTSRGYRWSRGGMVFGHYFHDVIFITEKEAKDYEHKLRKEYKNETT